MTTESDAHTVYYFKPTLTFFFTEN